jgi:predicted DNA-binding transcriptional regulator YafY
MRADRLLTILLLLQSSRRLTARELAQRLEVSERTIQRDMEALGMAGIPVLAERGNGGGWELLEPYRTDLHGLNPSEAGALVLAQPSHLLADLGLRQAAESALIKLLAALPALVRRNAEVVRQRIHVDGAGWRQWEEQAPALPVLQSALWQDRKLELSYQRGDQAVVQRVVDPLGLVAKGSVWYLVAAVAGEVRSYRVARIQQAQLTDQPSERPEGFDLAAYWDQAQQNFRTSLPHYHVTLRINSALFSWARTHWRFGRIERVEPPGDDGWQQVQVDFEVEETALLSILGLGGQVEVVAPASLRTQLIAQAEGILERYKNSTHTPNGAGDHS